MLNTVFKCLTWLTFTTVIEASRFRIWLLDTRKAIMFDFLCATGYALTKPRWLCESAHVHAHLRPPILTDIELITGDESADVYWYRALSSQHTHIP